MVGGESGVFGESVGFGCSHPVGVGSGWTEPGHRGTGSVTLSAGEKPMIPLLTQLFLNQEKNKWSYLDVKQVVRNKWPRSLQL